jgi:hypothetical protein
MIPVGGGRTVTTTDVLQPVEVAANTIVEVPAATPVTVAVTPAPTIVATADVPLVHEPVSEFVKIAVWRSQILVGPPIAGGSALTLIILVATQPVDNV